MLNVPFFSIKKQYKNIKIQINNKLEKLLESNQFVNGPYVKTFETSFAHYIQSHYAIGCNSGTDALWLALKALNLTPKSLVLTTPFSFIASSSEIVAHGAYPIFIDIDDTYNICPHKIEQWLQSNAIKQGNTTVHKQTGNHIAGILPVNIFGQCPDYAHIQAIAKEWNLWIVEDACQSVGARIGEQRAGAFGDIACFSLYPTKNLGVFGDGGVLTTNNEQLAQALYKLRNHGRASHYNYECYGINSRLDAIQALVADEKLKILDALNNRRREIAHIYTARLQKLVTTPQERIGHHVYHQYCIQADRDNLRKHLTEQGIGTNIFYPKTLDAIPFLTPPPEFHNPCPVAHAATERILALPIWPELTDEEVDYICTSIESFYCTKQSETGRPCAPSSV